MGDKEKILHDLKDLYRDMREVNVRSYGLKISTHESWCIRVEGLIKRTEALLLQPVPPPPPPAP